MPRTSPLAKYLRARITGKRLNDWQTYHEIIASYLRPGTKVLEVGCGRGSVAPFPWRAFSGVELTGLDPDAAAKENPFLDRFLLLTDGALWPVEDESADLVVCRYVLEHVEGPEQFFSNAHRVLKPGGSFICLTPNIWHPLAALSRAMPFALKRRLLEAAKGVPENQVFPTYYRANSPPRIERLAAMQTFDVRMLLTKEFVPSGYLDFSAMGLLLSCAYFAAIVWTGWDCYFGAQIIAVLQKAELGKPSRCVFDEGHPNPQAWQTTGPALLRRLE